MSTSLSPSTLECLRQIVLKSAHFQSRMVAFQNPTGMQASALLLGSMADDASHMSGLLATLSTQLKRQQSDLIEQEVSRDLLLAHTTKN